MDPVARLLAMLFTYWSLDSIIGYVKFDHNIVALNVSWREIGFTVTERVMFITSGGFAAEILLGAVWGADLKLVATVYSLSMATNAIATALIAYRTWLVSPHPFHFVFDHEIGYSIELRGQFSLIGDVKLAVS
jgi:hypothetical protein